MKKTILFILLFSAVLCCKKKDPEPKCGCDGPVYKLITDEVALYSKGFFIVKSPSWYAALDCNTILANSSIADGDSVIISGRVRQSCSFFIQDIQTFMALPTPLEVTAIRKK